MTASTARIISASLLSGTTTNPVIRRAERPSLPSRGGDGLGLDGDVGELELGAAARAERVVELDHLAAAGAAAARLVAVVAVQDGGQQAGEGQDRRDHEPQEERRALD